MGLVRELGLETYPTHNAGKNVFEEAPGKLKRYSGTIPRLNPLVLADYGWADMRFKRIAKRVDPNAPWQAPDAEALDAETFESFIKRAARTRKAREALALTIRGVFSVEPADLSLLHAAFYAASAGGWDDLLNTEGGAQQDRIVGGSQLISLRMAEELGDRIALERPVTSVRVEDDAVIAGDLRARRLIVALPPALAGRIQYEPALPAARDQLTQRVPMGTVIKCMAIYDEPFWRADGLTGAATSLPGPVQVVFDNTPPNGTPGVLMGFLEGRDGRELARVPQDQRRRVVVENLTRIFGDRAANPSGYVDKDWSSEPYSRGCYAGVPTPGTWTDYGRALREPVGRIHWAGTETATRWMGYFDGAIQAGRRAAGEVLAAEGAAAPRKAVARV